MNPAKIEKLAEMAEQSASRIAREAMIFCCQAFSIFKDEAINLQAEKTLSQPTNEIEGNRFVTLPSRYILTAEQLAEVFQVKLKTIYKWAETGKIPSHKIGSSLRFNLEKVLEATLNDAQFLLSNTKPTLKESKLRMIK